jgi:hypothetical protein
MAYVPRSGSIQNTNFIAIGKTSSHIPAALVVANAIAEISAMFKRRQPEGTHSKARQSGAWVVATASDGATQYNMLQRLPRAGWGAIQAYNPKCNAMINGGWKTAFDYLKCARQTAPPQPTHALRQSATRRMQRHRRAHSGHARRCNMLCCASDGFALRGANR